MRSTSHNHRQSFQGPELSIRDIVITLANQGVADYQNDDIDNALANITIAISFYLIDPFALTPAEYNLAAQMQENLKNILATKRASQQQIIPTENLIKGANSIINYITNLNKPLNTELRLKITGLDQETVLEILTIWNLMGLATIEKNPENAMRYFNFVYTKMRELFIGPQFYPLFVESVRNLITTYYDNFMRHLPVNSGDSLRVFNEITQLYDQIIPSFRLVNDIEINSIKISVCIIVLISEAKKLLSSEDQANVLKSFNLLSSAIRDNLQLNAAWPKFVCHQKNFIAAISECTTGITQYVTLDNRIYLYTSILYEYGKINSHLTNSDNIAISHWQKALFSALITKGATLSNTNQPSTDILNQALEYHRTALEIARTFPPRVYTSEERLQLHFVCHLYAITTLKLCKMSANPYSEENRKKVEEAMSMHILVNFCDDWFDTQEATFNKHQRTFAQKLFAYATKCKETPDGYNASLPFFKGVVVTLDKIPVSIRSRGDYLKLMEYRRAYAQVTWMHYGVNQGADKGQKIADLQLAFKGLEKISQSQRTAVDNNHMIYFTRTIAEIRLTQQQFNLFNRSRGNSTQTPRGTVNSTHRSNLSN